MYAAALAAFLSPAERRSQGFQASAGSGAPALRVLPPGDPVHVEDAVDLADRRDHVVQVPGSPISKVNRQIATRSREV